MRDTAMVTFVLSHACPLKCDFCCSTQEVVGPGRLERAVLEDCLIRFGGLSSVTRFAFTGGDPFLFLSDITAALTASRQAGVQQPFQVVTSAYWAKSADQVHDVLSSLRALGLDLIGLSYDREHARWVSAEQIRLVCDAATRLGIKINMTGVFWDEADTIEALWPDLPARPGILVRNLPVAPIGRATEGRAWPTRQAPADPTLSCGQPGVYSLSIYPDGEVYPCCSGGFQIEGKLSCGNVHRDRAEHILYSAMANFHVRLVKEFGWTILYDIVARDAPDLLRDLPPLDTAGGVCELCRDLNLAWAGRLAPIYRTIELEYAKTRAEFEWRSLVPASSPDGQLWCDDRLLSWPELAALLTDSRDQRLDYLAGAWQISVAPPDAPVASSPS